VIPALSVAAAVIAIVVLVLDALADIRLDRRLRDLEDRHNQNGGAS
jgi:hypothetical protein